MSYKILFMVAGLLGAPAVLWAQTQTTPSAPTPQPSDPQAPTQTPTPAPVPQPGGTMQRPQTPAQPAQRPQTTMQTGEMPESTLQPAGARPRVGIFERIDLDSVGNQGDDTPSGLIEDEEYEERTPSGPVPDSHQVKKGDTLWDICSGYFGSPWMWPKVWALNPQITNPHWIYPGDQVRLMPTAGSPEAVAFGTAAQRARSTTLEGTERVSSDTQFRRQYLFVDEAEFRAAGTVTGVPQDKNLMSKHDEIYVDFGDESSMRPGDRYGVYREVERVVRPGEDSDELGWLVEVIGAVEVREITKSGIARALLTDSTDAIERGMRVAAVRRTSHQVRPRTGKRELSATIVATYPRVKLLAPDATVVLDRGEDDGVQRGYLFSVVRSGDRLLKPLPAEPAYPIESIGEILVLDVSRKASVGVVTRAERDAQVGDRAWLRRDRESSDTP